MKTFQEFRENSGLYLSNEPHVWGGRMLGGLFAFPLVSPFLFR